MKGGTFALSGGFWTNSVTGYACMGDMNRDGLHNGKDIFAFIECLKSTGPCDCASYSGNDGIGIENLPVFVNDLLRGDPCSSTRLLGGVNGDGFVDVADASALANVLVESGNATSDKLWASDTNQDGIVDGQDIATFIGIVIP